MLRTLWQHQAGATSIEYALIGLLVSIAAVAVIGSIGTRVAGLFAQVATSF